MTSRKTSNPKRGFRPAGLAAIIVAVCIIIAVVIAAVQKQQEEYRIAHLYDDYPIQYSDIVEAAAEEFQVEEAYIYAVILAESSFRAEAESSVGALGLMQIMPDTGAWLAGKLGIENFETDMLKNPETNVRMGAWYLRFLLDRYDGDKQCASAAYHAGQGTVDGWLQNEAYSSDGKTLTVIPYDSTNNYVTKVLRNYENYLALLAQ